MRENDGRLLADDEPVPVRVVRADGRSDFFLTADHSGRLIPRQLGKLGLPDSELDRHIAWDIGIAGTTERLADVLDATAVLQTYSRLVIDCNRTPGHPTSIPDISESTLIPGNRDLSDSDRDIRHREIFVPYHGRIAELLATRRAGGRRTVLIAMHSFTPVFKGEPRSVEVGVLYNRDIRLANIMLDLFRAEGDLVVGDNAPYAITDTSDYTAVVYGERGGLPYVEFEIRQDLITDPAGQTAWAERLARLLPIADRRLRELTI